nr:hypothetical protein [Sphingobium sp. YR768]
MPTIAQPAAIAHRQGISFGGKHHVMVSHGRRISQRRPHIIRAQIGKIRDNLVHARRKWRDRRQYGESL